MTTKIKIALLIVALAVTGGTSDFAAAQYPSKPIRILVTAAAGGNLDVLARAVAEPMSKSLGQPVVVENMTGAGGLIAIRLVAKQAAPDGYTLLAASNTVALAPGFRKDPGYDPTTDLVGIGDMQAVTYILMGPASQPAKTATDLIAAAKAQAGHACLRQWRSRHQHPYPCPAVYAASRHRRRPRALQGQRAGPHRPTPAAAST